MPVTATKKSVSISDGTELSVPLRNLIAIVFAVASGTWGYFTLVERINELQSHVVLLQVEQKNNSNFRVKWPLGQMGSLPADARQDMLLENIKGRLSDLSEMGQEFQVVRMRVASLEDFAARPSRSKEHIKQVEIRLEYLTAEIERMRNAK